ncbi:tetratricopeptide repeat protein 21B-like [Drosophila hydei]|uniref:Tetratricopeptide repeat protein 21B-like n=1 Tax=Drosophila hydei TaxID=7224 RepID=A0A6J1LW43_DROHY|nr:tetratricopeptide repeat protein 21B-like [Drosophila hydei]
MDSNDFKSLVLYYGRLRFYNSMQKTALDGLAKFPMQSEFRLYNGIALALGNHMQECIRELNPLKNDLELGFAATMTLIYAHKQCRLMDNDAIDALEKRIEEGGNTLSSGSCYYTAVFLFLVGELDGALDYIGRSMKIDVNYDAALVLKIWCELSSSTNQSANGKWQSMLEGCIARSNGKNIDASLALVRFYQQRRQFDVALSVINKLSMRFPDIRIPLIEKMETQLAALDWDSALDTANRVVNMEPFNVAALRTKGMLNIVRESNFKAAAATLQQLLISVERIEPSNLTLVVEICQLFSRICSRNIELLKLTLRCLERINELNPGSVSILTELGYQKVLIDNVPDAELAFRSACNVDSTNFDALCGLTLCKLKYRGDLESRQQIQQQLAYLMKLTDLKPEPMVMYMSALLGDSKEEESATVQLLVEAAEIHFKKFSSLPFGFEYVCSMNPDFMLGICGELIRHTPAPIKESHYDLDLGQESLHITVKHSLSILEIILHICPGHQGALFLQAKLEFLSGEHSKAISRLQHILNLFGDTFTEAHLLLAQVLVEKKQYFQALEYLELALAQNFTVRERPMYYLLKGIILKHQQKLSEAHQSFLLALKLVGGISTVAQMHDYITPTDNNFITSSDKMTIYIELIYVLREIGDVQGIYESERILQSAIEEFNGTTEMGRLVIAHSQLMLEKCNVTEAINLLSTIKPDQSYYIQAKTHLANIYLTHQKNRNAFSQCFKELVEARPEPRSYLMLGEAYLSIQESDMAIDAYRKACSICPTNALLARKLGRSYVKTHQYTKALKYYHEAIQNPGYSALKLDLAELFLQLKQYQNAAKILSDSDRQNTNDGSLMELQLQTKQLLLLARIHEKSGNIPESLKTLQRARDNQYRVHKLCTIGHVENLYEQSKILSKICILIAQQAIKIKNSELTIHHFKECIKYTPNDLEILVSLAHLQMESKEMDLCRNTCQQILQIDGNNETASVLMADLSFRKMEFKNAAYHFSQLLLSQPCNWTALARLIEVMRRSGTLSESLPFMERAEQASLQSKTSTGYAYCKGLFEWYNGNLNSALRYFNQSRRDHIWGQQAKLNMIEICINPDGEIPSANDLLEAGDSGEFSESRLIALRTAERLLKEMRPRTGEIYESTLNRRIFWNFLQMASKQKLQVELALKDLTELMQKEGNPLMVTVVYAIALALVQLKQMQRAKNQLKRIARLTWNYEDAEYLERSWLLLADIYIHANKLDVAETFVERVLEYNKSSTKAYELGGYIAEKLQSYGDAAKQYQKAWDSCGHSKPHIGYKLALNNMKKKQYADAVNICQQVLKLHPDYNIIRKDILEKCRNNLRT